MVCIIVIVPNVVRKWRVLKLTLNDFAFSLAFSITNRVEILVVDYEVWEDEIETFEILFTIKGDIKSEKYLNSTYAQANIVGVYALDRDKFLVQIEKNDR